MADIRNAYSLTYNLVPGLPQTGYRNGVGAYEGVVAHSTGISDARRAANSDTPSGERGWTVQNWNNAFAHIFVGVENGAPVITVIADPKYSAWHVGGAGNPRFVGVELCEYNDPKMFAQAYDAYVWVLAKLLFDRKLGVDSAADGVGTLWAHAHVSQFLGGTDHQDPLDYLPLHGVSWDKVVADVSLYYQQMVAAATPPKAAPAPVAPKAAPVGPFPDVPANAWYAQAVAEMKADGVFTGDEKGNFNPDQGVSRAEAAVLLRRLKHAITGK